MPVKTQKIEPNNFIIDAYLRGKMKDRLSEKDIQAIIDLDITTYYDCITYMKVLVDKKTDNSITELVIHMVLKTFGCNEAELIPVIEGYLERNFIENQK